MATAARVKDPAALQRCKFDTPLLAAGSLITPQGLSRVIHNLETDLGTTLFMRTPSGMLPTDSGVYLYENSRTLLQELDALETGIRRFQNQGSRMEIGFSCGVLNVFPLQKLEAYKKRCPTMTIQWEEASNQDVLDKVLKRELDVGFVIGQVGSRELWVKELFRIQLSVLVYEGHPLYGRESLSVQDLQGESLISLNEKFSCYHSLVERCRDFGFVPAGGMRSGPASPAMKAVWAGSRNIP